MAQMQDSQGDCVWRIGRATSSPPDTVEDPEMSEAVAEERHEEVEQSNEVGDSDTDRRQTLSRPTLSGPYYEPGTVEGGGFENAISQSLARPMLTAIDTRRLSTSPAELDSSDGIGGLRRRHVYCWRSAATALQLVWVIVWRCSCPTCLGAITMTTTDSLSQ